MAQPDKPNSSTTATNHPRTEHQDTVLLSEIPEASALVADSPTAPVQAQPELHQLSSQVMAVLSRRYDILGEAGHGSMGSVYKARDRETGEVVALKLLKPEIASDQAMMERFKNELLFARKITHKNVCRVHEFNRLGGIAYTSMEFVEGESLRSVLNRFGGLPIRKALDLAQQICSGLQEAHAQGIVHRDLKPENVMMDAQGNVKIMDFGIARSMEAGTRLTGSMVGTPAYMAPEQVAGKPVDYRTDVYSLGLILYEVFTGAPAFQAENAVAVALKQMREAPTPPHEIEPTVPVPVERAILKCIEKEPAKRFQTVADLKNALKAPANAAPPVPAVTPQHHSSHGTPIASHPLYGSSALSVARPKKSASPVLWIFLLLLLGGGAYAGTHWQQLQERAQQILAPPPAPEAPKPPDFALNGAASTPSAEGAGTRPSAPSEGARPDAAPTQSAASADKGSDDNSSADTSSAPASKPVKQAATDATATDPKDQSAANAPDDSKPERKPAAKPPQETPFMTEKMANYVWVGRFEREDRAEAAAKKIEDLGLPVDVVPRRSLTGTAYVVVTGPFGPDRVTSVIDWLKTQGFMGVHPLTNPLTPNQNFGNRPGSRPSAPED